MNHILLIPAALLAASALLQAGTPVPVTVENFGRAETDLYFAAIVKQGGFARFEHNREVTPLNLQTVVRMNRDTLYSSGVFDLDAGPVTVTLPDAGDRFISMQVFDEDQYTHDVIYQKGDHTFTKEKLGTRYLCLALRILVNPVDAEDVKKVHALQDAVRVSQAAAGSFEVPAWDQASQKKVRDALVVLADTLPDKNRMFGKKEEVDPVRRLLGVASAWGGNPDKDAVYLNVFPEKNDGTTVHQLTVRDVPVDAFWSISVYNAEGYFEANKENAYTVNNITAKKNADGSVTVQFGGVPNDKVNHLPITKGWNYMVRLYRPQKVILDGSWQFPVAQPRR